MIKLKNVIGSKEASKELIIGKDTVYIHTNIRPYEDKNDEKSDLYIYDEVQMSLHEYLEVKVSEQLTQMMLAIAQAYEERGM